ncbi:Uncharacterised protein [Klebsiella pneumoniae]|nr:Uncharacterised protein [Klebsiella pneumoniae]
MALTFLQVVAVLHGQRDQVGAQLGVFFLDDLPAGQIGPQRLGAAPDGAERAHQVLLAESRVVQPYLAHGEVLPEVQVVAAGGEACGGLGGFDSWNAPKVFQHLQRAAVRLAVACYPVAEVFSFIDPCMRPVRQERSAYGGFLFGHAWPSFPCSQHTCC